MLATSNFGARGAVVLVALALAAGLELASGQQDNCKIECYPNTRMINGKGAKGDNCRWIVRTDGKPARLCDHIKCRKVCPAGSGAPAAQDQQEAAASAPDALRIEQQLEAAPGDAGAQGAMRHLHGAKLAKAPVPGVAGGRLAAGAASGPAASGAGRRMAPTLPPAVQYDENDTPPPISRFLDISPEE